MTKKLKVGVVGCGYLGKFHAEKYAQNALTELVGVYDQNIEKTLDIANQNQTQACNQFEDLINQVEAMSIVTPTQSHFQIANQCLKKGLHVFIEKPITTKIEDAKVLIKLADEQNKILQVGHSERYNPSYQKALEHIKHPKYIEAIRIAPFLNRATDVDVIHDLMIHDLDIIAQHCDMEVDEISGTSLSVISNEIDFAQAIIKFKSGTSVHLTASRISPYTRREMTFYANEQIVNIDFANLQFYAAPLQDAHKKLQIQFEHVQFEKKDIIATELQDFAETILQNKKTTIDGNDGLIALKLAHKIKKNISE